MQAIRPNPCNQNQHQRWRWASHPSRPDQRPNVLNFFLLFFSKWQKIYIFFKWTKWLDNFTKGWEVSTLGDCQTKKKKKKSMAISSIATTLIPPLATSPSFATKPATPTKLFSSSSLTLLSNSVNGAFSSLKLSPSRVFAAPETLDSDDTLDPPPETLDEPETETFQVCFDVYFPPVHVWFLRKWAKCKRMKLKFFFLMQLRLIFKFEVFAYPSRFKYSGILLSHWVCKLYFVQIVKNGKKML